MRLSPLQVEQDLRLLAARKFLGDFASVLNLVLVRRPVEFAFGELEEAEVYMGCDNRPIKPAHLLAALAGQLRNGSSPQAGAGKCACAAD
jgi:hypothetical protein